MWHARPVQIEKAFPYSFFSQILQVTLSSDTRHQEHKDCLSYA